MKCLLRWQTYGIEPLSQISRLNVGVAPIDSCTRTNLWATKHIRVVYYHLAFEAPAAVTHATCQAQQCRRFPI